MLIIRFREQVNKILEAWVSTSSGECQDTQEPGGNTVQRRDVGAECKAKCIFTAFAHAFCSMLPS